jgi:hypothetical protein
MVQQPIKAAQWCLRMSRRGVVEYSHGAESDRADGGGHANDEM